MHSVSSTSVSWFLQNSNCFSVEHYIVSHSCKMCGSIYRSDWVSCIKFFSCILVIWFRVYTILLLKEISTDSSISSLLHSWHYFGPNFGFILQCFGCPHLLVWSILYGVTQRVPSSATVLQLWNAKLTTLFLTKRYQNVSSIVPKSIWSRC